MSSSTLRHNPQGMPTPSTLAAALPPPRVNIVAPGPSAYGLKGIEVRGADREAGRGCFATRSFAAGEVVFSEDPLALLPPNALAHTRYLTFSSSSPAIRGLMLDMSLPDDLSSDPKNTAAAWVGQARASVDAALATHPELASVGADLLMKVHLAWTFNAYAFRPTGSPAGDPPHSAMFATGSKVSEDDAAGECGPSLFVEGLIHAWPHVSVGGGQHVRARDAERKRVQGVASGSRHH